MQGTRKSPFFILKFFSFYFINLNSNVLYLSIDGIIINYI